MKRTYYCLALLVLLIGCNATHAQVVKETNPDVSYQAHSGLMEQLHNADIAYNRALKDGNRLKEDQSINTYRQAWFKASAEELPDVSKRLAQVSFNNGNRFISAWQDYDYASREYEEAIVHIAFPNLNIADAPLFQTPEYKQIKKALYDCYLRLGVVPEQSEAYLARAKKLGASHVYASLGEMIIALELQPDSVEVKQMITAQLQSIAAGRTGEVSRSTNASKHVDYASSFANKISKKLSNTWVLPVSCKDRSLRGTVSYSVKQDGTLLNVRIRESSGVPEFDSSLVEAVKSTFPISSVKNFNEIAPPTSDHIYLIHTFNTERTARSEVNPQPYRTKKLTPSHISIKVRRL